MEIRNEIKQKDNEVEKKKFVVRSAADIQRAKLEKLMKNPDKPVVIPAASRNRDMSTAIPSFVRNVMGSSAGAGSGEFHVYRHLRRKEYARQKQIQQKSHAEQLDDAFQEKLESNRKAAEERTAKKRNKRLKKKNAAKRNRLQQKPFDVKSDDTDDSSEASEEEEGDGGKGENETESKKDAEEPQQAKDSEETTSGKGDNGSEEDDKPQLTDKGVETEKEKSSSGNDAQTSPIAQQSTGNVL